MRGVGFFCNLPIRCVRFKREHLGDQFGLLLIGEMAAMKICGQNPRDRIDVAGNFVNDDGIQFAVYDDRQTDDLHRVETIAAIKQPLGAVLIRKDYDRRVEVVAFDILAELAQFALGHGRQQIACVMDRQDAAPVLRHLPAAGLQCGG